MTCLFKVNRKSSKCIDGGWNSRCFTSTVLSPFVPRRVSFICFGNSLSPQPFSLIQFFRISTGICKLNFWSNRGNTHLRILKFCPFPHRNVPVPIMNHTLGFKNSNCSNQEPAPGNLRLGTEVPSFRNNQGLPRRR